jgi:hypothetical protein
MPIDAWGFRTLRGSGVQNPHSRCWPKSEDGAAASAATPDGDASVPPNAGPRADCGHGDAVAARRSTQRRNLRLRRAVVIGARAASQALLGARTVTRCPLRRVAQTSASRGRDRHGVIGEMANRSAYRGARHRDKSGRQRWVSIKAGATGKPIQRRQTRVFRGMKIRALGALSGPVRTVG